MVFKMLLWALYLVPYYAFYSNLMARISHDGSVKEMLPPNNATAPYHQDVSSFKILQCAAQNKSCTCQAGTNIFYGLRDAKTGELDQTQIYLNKSVSEAPFMIDCTPEFFDFFDPLPNSNLMACFCRTPPASRCTLQMFDNDSVAYHACVTQWALQ